MCGFTGFTNFIKDDGTVLGKMMDRIVHRGPDSSGQFVDGDIALGFRRLSIIDLAEGGQPMFNEDKSLVLVFNGEIYNFKQLREQLLKAGHTFANNSDSEVLLHGFEEWGEELVAKLRGMFAFVIFDRRDRSLFAARDMFGIKPFYYTFMGESFIFGSEIKSFLDHPDFKKELNEEALAHFLSFQYSPTEETQSCNRLCAAAPAMLKPMTDTDLRPDKRRITTVEPMPAVSENSSVNGVEKSRADKIILTVLTARAPLKSPPQRRSRTIELASPNFIPGTINESG